MSTYTWQDAFQRVAAQVSRSIADSEMLFAINDAQALIWYAYDWRESLKELAPFWLVSLVQDYSVVPSDFSGLRKAWFSVADPNAPTWAQLEVKKDVNLTHIRGVPTILGYVPEKNKLRVWPLPPEGVENMLWQVSAVYKAQPTKITSSNVATFAIPWRDQYFRTCCLALLWALTPEASERKLQLRQELEGELRIMAVQEGTDIGEPPSIAPKEPLVRHVSVSWWR